MQEQRPSPTLNTVIMVEEVIKNSKNSIITIPEIKRNLPKQVNHYTLMTILEYLERSNKIVVTLKGITWIHNTNANLRRAIAKGMEI
jgi:hypothetical protein